MNLETRKLEKVKFNKKLGIKKSLKRGTLFITTALILFESGYIKCGSEQYDSKSYSITTEKENNDRIGLLIKKNKRKLEELKKIKEIRDKTNLTVDEAYNSLKMDIINKLLQQYCMVYNIEYFSVYKIAIENTENFTSKKFLKNNNFMLNDEKYDNLELSVLEFIRDIKFNSEKYNININEITTNEYEKEKTIRKMVRDYSKLYNVDPNLILSIEFIESGYYTQPIATNRNNPGSLRGNPEFYIYENLEQGIIEHIRVVKKYYIDQGLDTPNKMQSKYCPDGSNWAECVNEKLNILNSNPDAYELYDEVKEKVKK